LGRLLILQVVCPLYIPFKDPRYDSLVFSVLSGGLSERITSRFRFLNGTKIRIVSLDTEKLCGVLHVGLRHSSFLRLLVDYPSPQSSLYVVSSAVSEEFGLRHVDPIPLLLSSALHERHVVSSFCEF